MAGRLQSGTLVAGRYTIVDDLGQGGNASVHRAFDERLKTEIALKVLWPQLATDPMFIERFRREAQTLARLSHPNIVRMFELSEDDDLNLYYLVLEYMPGGSLRSRLGPTPWKMDQALDVLRPVGMAIDYAHSRQPNIIHRDLKPSNILFSADERPVVGDFGLARLLATDSAEPTLTGGSAIGTPAYMAPEQIRGQSGSASDRYALAVIAYEMLAGRVPHQGSTPLETLVLVSSEPAPWAQQINPAIEASVAEVLQKALQVTPDARYPTADLFLTALSEAGQRPSRQPASRPSPRPPLKVAEASPTLGTPPPGLMLTDQRLHLPAPSPVAQPPPAQPPTRQRMVGQRRIAAAVGTSVLAIGAVAIVLANRVASRDERAFAPIVAASTSGVVLALPPAETNQAGIVTLATARPTGPSQALGLTATVGRPATPTATLQPTARATLQPTTTLQPAPVPQLVDSGPTATTRSSTQIPAPKPTPSETELWDSLSRELDPLWGSDWPRFTEAVSAFVDLHPGFAPAKDKLYAALVEYAKDSLASGATDQADAALKQAQALLPGRPEAFDVAVVLTPTATALPPPTRAPTAAPLVRSVSVPATNARPTVPPVPAVPPTKQIFQP